MKVSKKEIEVVSLLEVFERYKYFIKKVADWGNMYTLVGLEENWSLSVIEGHWLFPLWPYSDFAEQCKVDRWSDFLIKKITIDDFEETIIPLIENEGYLLNIFPTGLNTGFVVNLDEFIRDLSEELKNYE